MKIYDLCVNEGLVGGIYRYRAARGGLNFKIYGVCFDALRGGRRKFYRGSVVVAQQWQCACTLHAALTAGRRERSGWLCGACCDGSSEDRVQ